MNLGKQHQFPKPEKVLGIKNPKQPSFAVKEDQHVVMLQKYSWGPELRCVLRNLEVLQILDTIPRKAA